MMNKYKSIIFVTLGLLLGATVAHSQSKAERIRENKIQDAVEQLEIFNAPKAEQILSSVLKENPESDAAWFYMGHIAILKGNIYAAQEYMKKAVELDPENFWYRYKLAKMYSYTNMESAVQMYEDLIEDFPKRNELYYEMVELYSAQKEYDKALQAIYEIEQAYGSIEGLTIYAYKMLQALGREQEGIEYLQKYNSKYSSPEVLSILADSELMNYNDSTAIKYYDEALELDSNYTPALIGKAEAYRIFRRYNEYFPSLNRYLEAPSISSDEKTDYLYALIEQSDPNFIKRYLPQIDTAMVKLSEVHPGDSLVYNLRGIYYFYTARNDAAAEQYKECASKFPESYNIAASYVEFLMYDERWDELSEEGRKYFDRFPNEPAFLEMACMGDYNQKRYDKVLEICDKILEVAPSDSASSLRAWSTRGDVYHLLGDKKKAYNAYDQALKINPDYIYVLNNYAYFLSLDGEKLKKAYEMSRKTVEAEPDNATYLDTYGWILYQRGDYVEAKSFFKNALLHGGKESAVILDHYAEVLYTLREYDLAFIYWNLALQKDWQEEIPDLEEKIESRRKEAGR